MTPTDYRAPWIIKRRIIRVVLFIIIVLAPFAHVAMHVVQAKAIRWFLSDPMRISCADVPCIRFVPGVIAKLLFQIAKVEPCRRDRRIPIQPQSVVDTSLLLACSIAGRIRLPQSI